MGFLRNIGGGVSTFGCNGLLTLTGFIIVSSSFS